MIYALFGLPGSGKSYYTVKNFIVDRIVQNHTVISNIALSENYNISDSYLYLQKNDMDNLHNNIKKIMEDENKSHDDKKILLSKLFTLYGTGDITLIIDECHLYGYRGRSTTISYLDDFLSIHRHIFTDRKIDIILITQVPTRLNTEISAQVEVAIQCIPASQRLTEKLLEYTVYGSVDALRKKDSNMKMKKIITRGNSKIFDLYQSGYKEKGSGDFRKKLLIIVSVVFIVSAFVINRFYNLTSNVDPSVNNIKKNVSVIKKDFNKTLKKIEKNYKIICVSIPAKNNLSFPNILYTIIQKDIKQICYKKEV